VWLDKNNISWHAYVYCRNKDNPKIRKFINSSWVCYLYCSYIKDDPKLRKYITVSSHAYNYCYFVRDDPNVRKYITDIEDLEMLKIRRKVYRPK